MLGEGFRDQDAGSRQDGFGERPQPTLYLTDILTVQGFMQALFHQASCPHRVAGAYGVRDGVFRKVIRGAPGRGQAIHVSDGLLCLEPLQLMTQQIEEKLVKPIPTSFFAQRHEKEVRPPERLEKRFAVSGLELPFGKDFAQRATHLVEERHAHD